MPSNPYAAYLEASITTAEPVELIRMLYRGALEAVRDAAASQAAGQIQERSRALSKASDILRELSLSLNHKVEPAISKNLLELYDYMQRRLMAAHLQQSDIAIEEVSRLLATMSDAWEKVNPPASHGQTAEPNWNEPDRRIAAQV
jgi:flagellar secretion chaperone FliS